MILEIPKNCCDLALNFIVKPVSITLNTEIPNFKEPAFIGTTTRSLAHSPSKCTSMRDHKLYILEDLHFLLTYTTNQHIFNLRCYQSLCLAEHNFECGLIRDVLLIGQCRWLDVASLKQTKRFKVHLCI